MRIINTGYNRNMRDTRQDSKEGKTTDPPNMPGYRVLEFENFWNITFPANLSLITSVFPHFQLSLFLSYVRRFQETSYVPTGILMLYLIQNRAF